MTSGTAGERTSGPTRGGRGIVMGGSSGDLRSERRTELVQYLVRGEKITSSICGTFQLSTPCAILIRCKWNPNTSSNGFHLLGIKEPSRDM